MCTVFGGGWECISCLPAGIFLTLAPFNPKGKELNIAWKTGARVLYKGSLPFISMIFIALGIQHKSMSQRDSLPANSGAASGLWVRNMFEIKIPR